MLFDDDEEEKRLLEDIKFKRRVAFVDCDDIIEVNIPSFSKYSQKGDVDDKACQINIQNKLVSSGSQTRAKKDQQIQTELEAEETESRMSDADLGRLIKIFQKRTQLVEEALVENNESQAFQNYDVDWSETGTAITNPFTLIHQQLVKEEELHVTALEWTCSGATICAAYGRYDHESVCTHHGCLCTWNIDRIKIKLDKPDVSIETSCCISSLAAHPEYPAIVAVGLFNGEVHVYDIRQPNEPLVASVLDKKELHAEEITCLEWVKDVKTSKKKYLLLSGSRDGRILIWNALPAKGQLKLVEGFLMLIDNLQRNAYKALGSEMGVSAVSINCEDKDTFLVGCDSGGLFKCSLSSNLPAKSKYNDFPIELNSPVRLAFDQQHGPIYAIASSPFHRNLFLTCGTDSEVKLYSLLQTSHLMSFCPDSGYLYSVDWSPARPCVFACGSHKGMVLIYDIMESGSESASSGCHKIKASERPVYAVRFNHHRNGYMASGDAAGYVKVWRLTHELCTTANVAELIRLNDISEKPFEKT